MPPPPYPAACASYFSGGQPVLDQSQLRSPKAQLGCSSAAPVLDAPWRQDALACSPQDSVLRSAALSPAAAWYFPAVAFISALRPQRSLAMALSHLRLRRSAQLPWRSATPARRVSVLSRFWHSAAPGAQQPRRLMLLGNLPLWRAAAPTQRYSSARPLCCHSSMPHAFIHAIFILH